MVEFDHWAKYYDVIHSGLSGEMEFYRTRCTQRGGRILELGCGTGRVLLALAETGLSVTGLDQSKKMLDVCRQKIESNETSLPKVDLVHGDMRDFQFDSTFDTIVLPYRTLMHVVRPAQQLQCLRSIRNNLSADGRVFLNVWVPDHGYIHFFREGGDESEMNFVENYDLPDTPNRLDHFHKVITYPQEQLIIEEHLLIELNGRGDEVSRQTLPMTRTWYTFREMNWLIHSAGFETVNVWGDFLEAPLSEESEESVWELQIRRP